MFVVTLRFSANKAEAGRYMEGHKAWLKRGFDEGVFLLAGSLQPNLGGGIIAHDCAISEIERRVAEDPFVQHQIVSADILEIAPAKADQRLQFLLA